ncbi:MAG: hypothetical protein HY822_11765 [Acidobacteria bacterium]|nr:hypothetical protein [Acidobacteriota bacterium]
MADLNWMEFREVVPAKVRTVLLPTGTVEAHGVANNGADVTAPVIQRWRQAVARIPDAPVDCFRFADDVSWTDRLRYTSDSHDSDFAARSPDEPFNVVWVAGENRGLSPKGCRHHNGVNDIRSFGHA